MRQWETKVFLIEVNEQWSFLVVGSNLANLPSQDVEVTALFNPENP